MYSDITIKGYKLKAGSQTREIKGVQECYEIVKAWITHEEYLAMCIPGIGDLEKQIIPAWKITSPKLTIKDAKKELDELLDSVIIRGQNAPTIVEDEENK